MKYVCLFMCLAQFSFAQVTTTELVEENRWIVNSGINLPAIKFHLKDKSSPDNSSGYVELFSSFGVGLSMNYGKTSFRRDIKSLKVDEENIKFSNIVGIQLGVLYSSKAASSGDNDNLDYFSIYSGINILDVQLGFGKELGAKFKNSSGWFASISYGIPIYKLTGKGSFLVKPNETRQARRAAKRKSTDRATVLSSTSNDR